MSQSTSTPPLLRYTWRALLTVCVIALLVVFYKAGRIAYLLQSAYTTSKTLALELKTASISGHQPETEARLQQTATALHRAQQELQFFTPALERLGGMPGFGPTLRALPSLLSAGQALSEFAVLAAPLFQPLLTAPADISPITLLPQALHEADAALPELQQKAAALEAHLAPIASSELLPGLAEPVAGLKATVTLLAPALQLHAQLPALLGIDKPRVYLVLAQNNHELRATGGFLTAVGRVTIANGRVIGVEFVDSYAPELNRTDMTYPEAPKPLERYMHIEQLLLRDANWSPDFPTSAQLIQAIYTQATGSRVDGIITLDLRALEQFVAALEPLTVAGIKGAVTSENILAKIKEFWAAPLGTDATLKAGSKDWWSQRKDFIPRLAAAALKRIQQGDFEPLRMLAALHTALETRAIQLWVADATVTAELAQRHWDGALRPPAAGDFLALVDTNFGFNKVDAVLERAIHYQLEWPNGADQAAVATVAITYRHPYARPDYVCDQTPHYEQTYDEMIVRCYYDYVRLYTPPGSELLGIEGVQADSHSSQAGEGGAQVFSGFFVLQPGQQTTLTFRYLLPKGITQTGYQLTVRRQAGTPPLPFLLEIAGKQTQTLITNGQVLLSSSQ